MGGRDVIPALILRQRELVPMRLVARNFARCGASVTVTGTQFLTTSYDPSLADFSYLRLDLTNHDSIVRVADQVGDVDVLVSAAGARIPHSSDIHEQKFVSHSVRLGLLGPAQLAHRLRHRLGRSTMRGGGSVINTHHLRRSTARLGAAWIPKGIRVNGVVSTVVVPRQSHGPERSECSVLTHSRRTDTLQDVSSAVHLLASSGAAYVTGQTLMGNGSGAGGVRIAH